jgi:hypothetical protein
MFHFGSFAEQAPQSCRLPVNVNMVVPNGAVRDRKNQFAGGFEEGDFEVFEDGAAK